MKCYVCGNEIKSNPLYIGQGLYRHISKCKPLSENWLKSEVSRKKGAKEMRAIMVKIKERKDCG